MNTTGIYILFMINIQNVSSSENVLKINIQSERNRGKKNII